MFCCSVILFCFAAQVMENSVFSNTKCAVGNCECVTNRNLPYVQSILRKIFKTVAARCHLLRLKCTKFDFGWGSAQAPAGGAYVAPQTA